MNTGTKLVGNSKKGNVETAISVLNRTTLHQVTCANVYLSLEGYTTVYIGFHQHCCKYSAKPSNKCVYTL